MNEEAFVVSAGNVTQHVVTIPYETGFRATVFADTVPTTVVYGDKRMRLEVGESATAADGRLTKVPPATGY
jgi:hypothetical protein